MRGTAWLLTIGIACGLARAAPLWLRFELCTAARSCRLLAQDLTRPFLAVRRPPTGGPPSMLDLDGAELQAPAELGPPAALRRYLLPRVRRSAEQRQAVGLYNEAVTILRTETARARRLLSQAVELDPGHAGSLLDLGVLLEEAGDSSGAARLFERAVAVGPRDPLARVNLGVAYTSLRAWTAAEQQLEAGLGMMPPGHPLRAEGWNRLGAALLKAGWASNDFETAERALSVLSRGASEFPVDRQLQMNAMEAAGLVGRKQEAVRAARRLVASTGLGDPDRANVLSRASHAMREAVDWRGMRLVETELRALIQSGEADGIVPLHSLVLGLPPRLHRWLAESEATKESSNLAGVPLPPAVGHGSGLRVVYWSSEVRHHPVALLMESVLSQHTIEARLLSLNPPDDSKVRAKIAQDMGDRMIQLDSADAHQVRCYRLGRLMVGQVATAVQGAQLLVDLDGYSGSYFQHELVLARLTPVAINFLGYPATVGAPQAVLYIGTDKVTNPPDTKESVSERMVMLPWALMPTTRWPIPRPHHVNPRPVIGSFHKCGKLSPLSLTLWANAVPLVAKDY